MPTPCFLSSALKRALPLICLTMPFMLCNPGLSAAPSPPGLDRAAGIISKMETAYARMDGYQTETEVSEFGKEGDVDTKRFLYTFKKPYHLRIEMESPHRSMILVYPDEDGEVSVKPGGWAGFLRLHLSPDSPFLRSNTGQRLDQTDMGRLIGNIVHSLTDRSRGEIGITEQENRVQIEVLADDHFLAGVLTLYRFSIDKASWLPVEVVESTPDGSLKRKVLFRNLKPRNDLPDTLFRFNGGNPQHDQPD